MTCNHCKQEFDNALTTCPNCGRTLVYGAAAPAPNPEAPAANPSQIPFDLGDSSSGSFPALGTTISVSGSSSIRARLRPRGTFEIIGEAIRLYRQNWKLFWGIILIYYIPFTLLGALWGAWSTHVLGPPVSGDPVDAIFNRIPAIVFGYVPVFLVYCALIRAVSEKYLGRTTNRSEIMKLTPRFWGLVGANLIATAVIVVPWVIVFAVGYAAMRPGADNSAYGGAHTLLIGFIVSFIISFLAGIYWCICSSVAIIEGRGAIGSLRRSTQLIKGFAWSAFFILFLDGLMALVTLGVIQAIFEALALPLIIASGPGTPNLATVTGAAALGVIGIGQIVAAMIATPMILLPLVLFYYDLRVRKEAFDLQMLAEQIGFGYRQIGSE